MSIKLFSIVGARPQFIKVAALDRATKNYREINHFIIHTGQHYDYNLSGLFFKELDIPSPNFQLKCTNDFETKAEQMTEEIYQILKEEKPDIVLVYGDTRSTLAGALAAKKAEIKLAHIEAGIRSYDNLMPEEFNRIETDKISDFLFCPTQHAIKNLFKEGFNKKNKKIILSGDIMLDAFKYYSTKIDAKTVTNIVPENNFILCTLHRQALVQSPEKLIEIIKSLNYISEHIQILLPAHPRLKKAIDALSLKINFIICDPVGYINMLGLLRNCTCVITDSGGLQKEAFFSKKVCITIRNNTEWTELVEAGVNFIAGDSSANNIIKVYEKVISTECNFANNLYGEGNAAEIILDNIISEYKTE